MATQSDNMTPLRARRKRLGGPLSKADRAVAQQVFLDTFAKTANVAASCRKAEISRETFYTWQERDEEFSLRYNLAEQDAVDVVRAAIHRRGVEGWEEPLVSHGQLVHGKDGKPVTVRRYSDACLLALAKARVPEYRERVDVNMQGSVSYDHRIIDNDPEAAGIARALIQRLSSGGAS